MEILRRLRACSQVVSFVEVFEAKLYTILVTEHLSGGDLFERLSPPEYRLTEEKCQIFIRQILQGGYFEFKHTFLNHSVLFCFFVGVDFIHTKNIIHLDIKPFNILFSNQVDIIVSYI